MGFRGFSFLGEIFRFLQGGAKSKAAKADDEKVRKGATFWDYFWLGGSEFEACLTCKKLLEQLTSFP